MNSDYRIDEKPPPNFTMRMGDDGVCVDWDYRVNKTLLNRIRYWLFCKFFPFKIVRWDSEK